MSDYDRFYDMGLHCMFSGEVLATCNCAACNMMRGGGLEPPSLAAPDPKSGSSPATGNLTGTPRHSAPLDATERQPDYDQNYDTKRAGLSQGDPQ